MRRYGLILLFIGSMGLAACTAPGTSALTSPPPETVAATPNEISILAYGWGKPDNIASRHCARFGKRATYLAASRVYDEFDDQRLHYYRCD